MDNFVHLHCHSEYSLLDSVGKIKDFIDKAINLGQNCMAFTEHGNMNSYLKAHIHAKSKDFKVIPGIEAYLVGDMTKKGLSEEDKIENVSKKELQKERKKRNHLLILAKNQTGYKNLLKISSLGNIEGFYYKPRVDLKLVEKYKEGLIIASACIFGEIAESILSGDKIRIKDTLMRYKTAFGDNFYLEIQPHNFPDQIKVNKYIIGLSRKYNIKLVATNDTHYIDEEDYKAYNAITMLNMKRTISQVDEDRLKNGRFFLKTRQQMYDDFVNIIGLEYEKEINDALDNTVKIAKQVDISVDLNKYRMPKFNDIDVEKEIKTIIFRRLKKIIEKFDDAKKKKYMDRLKYEYTLMKDRELLDFIYIIYDVIAWAQKNNIYVGCGRGSASASLVCYLLDITKVDPLRYNLLFARFINANRIELPDIDIDFDSEHRNRIKQYLIDKYGKDKVSSVGAFGTFKSRGMLKDLARVFELPLEYIDLITKSIPMEMSLAEVKNYPLVRDFVKDHKDIWDIGLKLEGQVRHFSTHAAGVVISNDELYNDIPLCMYKNDIVTGWDEGGDDIKCISTMKMMKLDCLGLSTLTILRNTIELIKKRCGKDLKNFIMYDIEPNDPKVLQMASKGNTVGVFQFEGNSIRELIKKIGIDEFEHLVAANSLHRPAALKSGYANEYALRKNKKKPIVYIHPAMEKVLKSSYGLLVYQEDAMKVAKEVAGYTYDEADDLRKITSKGTKLIASGQGYLIDEARDHFIQKCSDNGVEVEVAREIFKFIETFTAYSFNRPHSVAYSIIAYQCMYLKKYYPLEFISSLLTYASDDEDITLYMREAKKMSIRVAPPNINKSCSSFSIHNSEIMFGLLSIKSVGEKAVEEIVKNQPFKNFSDFIIRTRGRAVNKRVVKALIDSGCFDILHNRKELDNYEDIISSIKK